MKVERIQHATVVSSDAEAAKRTFQDLFSLAAAGTAALTIGESRIQFLTPTEGARLGEALATSREGMAAICLRVTSLVDAAASLRKAGVAFEDENADGRRALHVDPHATHGVRLTLRDVD